MLLLLLDMGRGSGRMTPTPCYTAADDLGQLPRVHHAVLPPAHQTPTVAHQAMCGPKPIYFCNLVGWGCEGWESQGGLYGKGLTYLTQT